MREKSPTFFFYLKAETTPAGSRLAAYPGYFNSEGMFNNPVYVARGFGRHLAGLVVDAWVHPDLGTLSKINHAYHVHQVKDAARSEIMARTLRRIDRGLRKFHVAVGPLAEGDYAGHLFRAAEALDIDTFYIADPGGELTEADADGVQAWVQEQVALIVLNVSP